MGADLNALLGASTPTLLAVGAARRVAQVTRRARGAVPTPECGCAFGRDYVSRFPTDQVHLTSVYSKGDGVVRWWTSIVPGADWVKVTGSHIGLIVNRKAYRAIAGALSRPELLGYRTRPRRSGGPCTLGTG